MRDHAGTDTAEDIVDRRVRAIETGALPGNVGALLEEAASDSGDRLAWNFFESGETETYASLRDRTAGLAQGFAGLGIAKGTHVAVMLPNIAAFPLSWLALARLGAVMVPVNIDYRERELAFILENSETGWIVIHDSLFPILENCRSAGHAMPPNDRTIVVGNGIPGTIPWDRIARARAEGFEPAEPVTQDDLLNIQYTSGTTGFPKGCKLSQKYWLIAGKVNAMRDGLKFDRILASTPFTYMDPQWLLLMSIYQRATLIVARRQSTSRFIGWLADHEINFCLLPWILLKQAPSDRERQHKILRANVYGVPPHLHGEIQSRFGLVAREAFGMTEIGPAMFMPIEAQDMVGSGSCGRPVPYRRCRIADETGRTLPPGEIGELLVSGPGIMSGYYNNPEATAAAFRGEWFRTGDLFRMDERGYFYIVGRLKDMVRRNGENVAAREVEMVLNGMATVKESAVIGVPDEARGEEVKACIVLQDGLAPTPELIDQLVAHCKRELAPFKVPRYFSFRESFPRTTSQKIAKHALRAEAKDLRSGSYDRVENRWHP
ncbi:MAG TPA: AMP-binding protein [Dongiaceae bacterium]|nr:AMP-binding protein [Dongiaceae bacterium]